MFGNLGLPELLVAGTIALAAVLWPAAFFALGYYFGRRSTVPSAAISPPSPAVSAPPHV